MAFCVTRAQASEAGLSVEEVQTITQYRESAPERPVDFESGRIGIAARYCSAFCSGAGSIDMPPSITNSWAVMNDDSSDARNTTRSPMLCA